jgi:predicted transcriptional regulator
MSKAWDELLQRVQSWPENAQHELARLVLEIEKELKRGAYNASVHELAGIDRGLNDVAQGKFASPEDVEAVFAKHRRK